MTLPPFTRLGQKLAGGLELGEGLAQVNDMNAAARFEDERLHLGFHRRV